MIPTENMRWFGEKRIENTHFITKNVQSLRRNCVRTNYKEFQCKTHKKSRIIIFIPKNRFKNVI